MANKKQSRFLSQQKYVLGAFTVLVAGILIYFSTIVATEIPDGEFIEGEHYTLLENPRRIRGDKIEIMEFFSYGCVHCYNFDDDLADWVEDNEDKIIFVRNPAIANELWRTLGRAYYAMEELQMLDDSHSRFFKEIHEARRNLTSGDKIAELFANDEISKETFLTAFNSPAVTKKVNRADELSRRFKVATVPNIVVNGKYLVQSTRSVGLSRMLDVMDFLIEKEQLAKKPMLTKGVQPAE